MEPGVFGAHAISVALVLIVIMLVLVALTAWRFAKVDRFAGALLVPYLAWLCFATLLNASIVALN